MANIVSDTVLAENIRVLVDTGHFGNRVEEYLDDTFRTLKRDSFYSETLAAQGREAAEEQLAHWTKSRYMHSVANAVSPLAAGIAKVIATGHKDLRVTRFEQDVDRPGSFPFPYGASHGAYGVALHHLVVPGCGCMQPQGFNKFAFFGDGLRIQAFVVLIDPLNPRESSVALMLPIRDLDQSKAGYVALTFQRDGGMFSQRVELTVYGNAAELAAFGGQRSPIGFTKAAGGSPCAWLGFPGAEEYVVSALGELVEYLEDMAVKLSASHQH